MSAFSIVVTDDRYGGAYAEEHAVFQDLDAELIVRNCTDIEEIVDACRDAHGILCNLAPMPAEVIAGLRECKVISRYGVGYDNVDVAACTAKGIQVTNVTDYCAEEASDHALALMLACARKVARRDAQVRAGQWDVGRKDPIHRLAGRTFAFLGFGLIARCLLRKIGGLGFARALVYDPFVSEKEIAAAGCTKVGWDEALSKADFLSLHMPVTAKTRGIVDAEAFAAMKPTAILVNTARGAVVEETALIDALVEGKINSAGLDVHASEPLPPDSPLKGLDNCVLTDHVGWYSEESMSELKTKAAQNVRDVLKGRRPSYPVNDV